MPAEYPQYKHLFSFSVLLECVFIYILCGTQSSLLKSLIFSRNPRQRNSIRCNVCAKSARNSLRVYVLAVWRITSPKRSRRT